MILKLAAVVATAAAAFTPNSSMQWVCGTLDRNPNESGVWQVVLEAVDRGFSTDADAKLVADEISNTCPQYIPLLIQWAEHNGE